MYIQHFGLVQYPFSLAPNTRYFLKLPSHQQAFDFIIRALDEAECFTKITGEVGTGKTMLCRKVLNALEVHGNKYTTAFIPNPVLDEEGIMQALAEELELNYDSSASYYDLLKINGEALQKLSGKNQSVVLLIDEAQAIPEESLEAIRLLTSVEGNSDGRPAMQVILFGQPELDELLERPTLQELKRGIQNSYQLTALNRESIEAYLSHRLTKAGYNGISLFTQKAIDLIFQSSQGIPRLVNILAHKALMVAFGKGDTTLTDKHVQLAIDDTESAQQTSSTSRRFF